MKKNNFKNLIKKIEWKPILVSITLIVIQSIFYAFSRCIQGEAHLLGNVIDEAIMFNVYAIIPYSLWYFMLVIVPYYLYKKDKNNFIKYIISYLLVTIIANIIFVAYPTTVIRPGVLGITYIEKFANFIFKIDTPIVNCFPSLHCAISMLWILYVDTSSKTSLLSKILTTFICVCIMASTLIIKQHVVIDAISGIIIASTIFLLIDFEKKLTKKIKKLLKI